MLKRIHSRKGFTLAELLIVVAIIAILVAIALPLFFGALDSARNAVFEANQRSVKAAAVAAIFNDKNNTDVFKDATDNKILVSAKVDEKGNITDVTVPEETDTEATKDYADWKDNEGGKIVVELEKTDLKVGA